MLARAEMREGRLTIGSQSFAALYLDVEWLDADGLAEIERLASAGLKVVLKRQPRQPGHRPHGDYERRFDALAASPNTVPTPAQAGLRPLVSGENLPPYWARAKRAPTRTSSSPIPRPPRSAIRCPTDFQNATRRSAAGSLCIRPRRRPTWNSCSSLASLCWCACPKRVRSPRSIAGIGPRSPFSPESGSRHRAVASGGSRAGLSATPANWGPGLDTSGAIAAGGGGSGLS